MILPGVGMAATAMTQLRQHGLVECIRRLSQPVLGVCLGMQLMFEHSSEGDTEMLGVLAGNCRRFADVPGRSVPHMGWNRIWAIEDDSGKIDSGKRLLINVEEGAHVYFVHSYFAELSADTIASCDYGEAFTAIASNGNFNGLPVSPGTFRLCWRTDFAVEFSGALSAPFDKKAHVKGNKEKIMIIYPAIDLIDGAVVRLHKGDFAQKTTYGSNPIEVACGYREAGASWLHLVDLDGAKDPQNRQIGMLGEDYKRLWAESADRRWHRVTRRCRRPRTGRGKPDCHWQSGGA